ncbi:MAG TPA: hypothetical protein VIH99_11240 [Bdellovibrionota bacterium]|jgi:hypothetical protein
MTVVLAFLLLVLALLAALRSVTAASTERLLWGSLISSIALGLAVQLRGGGYYGILMVAVFVITDLMVYLFFRSLHLMPARPPRSARSDRIYRVFFLWLSLCAAAGSLAFAFMPASDELWKAPSVSAASLLYERMWSGDWLLTILPVLGLVVLVAGGFFLVRGEQ